MSDSILLTTEQGNEFEATLRTEPDAKTQVYSDDERVYVFVAPDDWESRKDEVINLLSFDEDDVLELVQMLMSAVREIRTKRKSEVRK